MEVVEDNWQDKELLVGKHDPKNSREINNNLPIVPWCLKPQTGGTADGG